jgi:hypothetical protein
MSNESPEGNPYQSPGPDTYFRQSTRQGPSFGPPDPLQVRIDPLDLLKRGLHFLGDQYWIFLAVTLVGVIIGSLVPLSILLGPMLVGFYLCLLERERSSRIEFGTLFRGFDRFLDSLLVILAVTVFAFLVILPFIALTLGLVVFVAVGSEGGEPSVGVFLAMAVLVPLILIASVISYLPFLFAFQLIAEHEVSAIDAIKLSCRAVWLNLGGCIWYILVVGVISMVATLMCYLPLIFFMPIAFTSLFLLYREIFPVEIIEAEVV